jgi:hypothetical protein
MTGISLVLKGIAREFEMEYPCHTRAGLRRWFRMWVWRFLTAGGYWRLVVKHENITELKKLAG